MIDRFAQIEPTVLLAVGGYRYGDRYVDRRAEVAEIRAALPTPRARRVTCPTGERDELPDAIGWDELLRRAGAARVRAGPVRPPAVRAVLLGHDRAAEGDRPRPRRDQLLEHHKNQGLSWDLRPGGRLMWFTTTAWMMWNALVSALLLRSSIVMLDGDPA